MHDHVHHNLHQHRAPRRARRPFRTCCKNLTPIASDLQAARPQNARATAQTSAFVLTRGKHSLRCDNHSLRFCPRAPILASSAVRSISRSAAAVAQMEVPRQNTEQREDKYGDHGGDHQQYLKKNAKNWTTNEGNGRELVRRLRRLD